MGKTFVVVGIILGFAATNPGCRVVVAAPTQDQLRNVLWAELGKAYVSAQAKGIPIGGKLRDLSLDFGDGWLVEGYGTGSVESKSGRHSDKLLAVWEEASGIPKQVSEALDSLNPSHKLKIGNPLKPEGDFYETCELRADDPNTNVITIPSLESPFANSPRSPATFGMADADWLQDMRYQYGEDSMWWASHILAKFPTEIAEALLPIPWLELAAQLIHVPSGDVWMGVDIGEGKGGDSSEIVCRDDNGIPHDENGLAWESSNRWTIETLAERVQAMALRFNVQPGHIVYDSAGIGADFDNRLRTLGLSGAKPYRGSNSSADPKYFNLRSAVGWALRRRLDPNRTIKRSEYPGRKGLWVPQHGFSLPPELLKRYRAELTGCQYGLHGDQIQLETKDKFVKRIKHSPNFLDGLMMTYAFPYA